MWLANISPSDLVDACTESFGCGEATRTMPNHPICQRGMNRPRLAVYCNTPWLSFFIHQGGRGDTCKKPARITVAEWSVLSADADRTPVVVGTCGTGAFCTGFCDRVNMSQRSKRHCNTGRDSTLACQGIRIRASVTCSQCQHGSQSLLTCSKRQGGNRLWRWRWPADPLI